MKFTETELSGSFIIEADVHRDDRGFFLEAYNRKVFENHGISTSFVQDNYSFSQVKGVLRGLHFQRGPHAQAKLVWVASGVVFDVLVDLRKGSASYGRWIGVELGGQPFRMVYIPKGFAHGFCTLTDNAHVLYKVDAFYNPSADGGVRWNDPELNISWPVCRPILSEKDSRLPYLRDAVL